MKKKIRFSNARNDRYASYGTKFLIRHVALAKLPDFNVVLQVRRA